MFANRLSINFHDITQPLVESSVGYRMPYEKRERWIELCKQAETEQDPEKLMDLVTEINRLLQDEENRRAKKQ